MTENTLSNILAHIKVRNMSEPQELSFWGETKMVKVIDNFFPEDVYNDIVNFIERTYQVHPENNTISYHWVPGHSSTGNGVDKDSSWFWILDATNFSFFTDELLSLVNKRLKTDYIARAIYFNGMCPGQTANFHTDSDSTIEYTLLLYVMPGYCFEWGGHTTFLAKDREDISVVPRPNRAVIFPSRMYHKAFPFEDNRAPMRVTLAFKLGPHPDGNT